MCVSKGSPKKPSYGPCNEWYSAIGRWRPVYTPGAGWSYAGVYFNTRSVWTLSGATTYR